MNTHWKKIALSTIYILIGTASIAPSLMGEMGVTAIYSEIVREIFSAALLIFPLTWFISAILLWKSYAWMLFPLIYLIMLPVFFIF